MLLKESVAEVSVCPLANLCASALEVALLPMRQE
jgi:hypothetical protein